MALTTMRIIKPVTKGTPINQYNNPNPKNISKVPNTKYANFDPTYIRLSVSI